MIRILKMLCRYRYICLMLICIGMKYIINTHGLNVTWQEDSDSDSYENRTAANESKSGILSHLPGYKYFGRMLKGEYLQKINPFWLQFDPPDKTVFYTFGVIYTVEFVVGCGGNLFVIIMFCRFKKLFTPATTLIFNLAISDFLMLAKCPIAIYNNFMQGPAMGDFGCRIYGFIGGLSGTASILTLAAIAVDRYNAVVNPMRLSRSSYRLRPKIMIIFIWTCSLIFSIIPALNIGYSVYVPEGFLTTCSFDYLDKSNKARVFMFTFFLFAYIIPLSIITFSYFYILIEVFSSDRIQANQNRNKVERKLTYIVILVILLWFIAWTPYTVVAMMGVLGYQEHLTPFNSMVPALFCKTAACINPYIYAATHPRFRLELKRLFNQNFAVRRISTFMSSFRSRSTNANRTRVIDALFMENNYPMLGMLNNDLEVVLEEGIVQEDDVDVLASVEVHNADNSKY